MFITVTMLLPLLALPGIEMLLRRSGFGGYEPILEQMEQTPQARRVVSLKASARDFFSPTPRAPGSTQKYIEGLHRLLSYFADAETYSAVASEIP